MGTSTDGILFFGIDLGECGFLWEEWLEENETDDIDMYVAFRLGVKEPQCEYSEATKSEYNKYFGAKRAVLKESGCSIEYHCSYDYPMFYVCLSDKRKRASRGYPEAIDKEFLRVTNEDVEKLKTFCEKVGIEWQEPSWMLTSLWG
jgi:hypothetical protein